MSNITLSNHLGYRKLLRQGAVVVIVRCNTQKAQRAVSLCVITNLI